MEQLANQEPLVAVDLGAQSCRVTLLRWNDGVPEMSVVHRFENCPLPTAAGLRWDIAAILRGIKRGLRLCAEKSPAGIASIAVDSWAVDYVRLDATGNVCENPYCYRDSRTEAAQHAVHARISPSRLYELTGIQVLPLNTLYQLYADQIAGSDEQTQWLNLAEYVTHYLGGRRVGEFTNATHTGLVGLGRHKWCEEIFESTGLPINSAPEIVCTGTTVGTVQGDLSSLSAYCGTKLIVPACHDTASAIAAIPATGDDWAFISSGTWSLVGTVLQSPCILPAAREMNFTNLGGVGGAICFLRNVNGMWLLRECVNDWAKAGHDWTVEELTAICEGLPAPDSTIDVDRPELMLPGDIHQKINSQLRKQGRDKIGMDSDGMARMANLVFHSLAKRYAEVLRAVIEITGKKLRRVFIVGGGSRNALLNRLTETASGLEVIAGPVECTTIGNFAIQMSALCKEGSALDTATVARYAKLLAASRFEHDPRIRRERLSGGHS